MLKVQCQQLFEFSSAKHRIGAKFNSSTIENILISYFFFYIYISNYTDRILYFYLYTYIYIPKNHIDKSQKRNKIDV